MEEKIRDILHEAVSGRIFPGAVAGVIDRGKVSIISHGKVDYEQSSEKVASTTLYDVASITKAVPTSSLALYFLDKKLLQLTDPVMRFLPEFRHKSVTILHLLTQTVSFQYESRPLKLSQLKDKSPKEIMENIYQADLSEEPGTTYAYNNATSVVLGKVVEVVGSATLDVLAQDLFFSPLGMRRTTFYPDLIHDASVAPTEIDEWRGKEVRGDVHDESASILMQEGAVGSAGLFSTASDLLLFTSMLLQKGFYEGKRFFSEELVTKMYENQLKGEGMYSGLGWEIHQPQYMGSQMSDTMFGKTGFTGCLVLLDIPKQKAMVLLSNYTYPKRKENAKEINQVRRRITDLLFAL